MQNVSFFGHRQDTINAREHRTVELTCGHCGRETHARHLATFAGSNAVWLLCPCGRPSTAIKHGRTGNLISQWPGPREYHAGDDWPPQLQRLFEEASAVLAASAPTSAAMICRKVLMVAAHEQGADEDQSFLDYVNYLTDEALTFPQAKTAIDRIRNIGNDANHEVDFVEPEEAREALQITHYLLGALYGFAGAAEEEDDGD